MTAKTAGDRLRYGKQFASVLQTGNAQSVLQLPPNKRIHIMKGLASLARFLGTYDTWIQIRQRYNLRWSTGNEALSTFQRFFLDDSKTMDTMLQWVKKAISVLPCSMGDIIKFNVLTGLRPSEALQAIRLIKDPETYKTYYNEDRYCLEHFRFPNIFIRRTKTAFISLVDKGLVKLAQNIEGKVPNYDALRFTFTRRHIGVGMHMAWCRKIYSSFLRQNGIESEIVDLLSGRVPKTVFARHYFTPSLDYRDKVMNALNKLKEQIEKKEE